MVIPVEVYDPAEDSKLILKHSLRFSRNEEFKICEVGVGTGFVIENIAKKFQKNLYYGSDINSFAIKYTREKFKKLNLNIKLSNESFMDGFDEKFDIIIFNTPYLPLESNEKYENLSLKDRAIYGGKYGYEVIEEFICKVNEHLENGGCVIMLFSSFSNQKYIEDILLRNLFEFEILERENVFFEDLICMRFWKSNILKKISENGVENIKYLIKGKHSKVFDGIYKRSKVIIKVGEPKDIEIESFFLKKLQMQNFVPCIYFYDYKFVVMEKFDGIVIKDFLQQCQEKKIVISVIDKIFEITHRLDELGINKSEMTNPYKHIYILQNFDVKMIDYERCIFTKKPKNTTQFLQYLRRNIPILKKIGIVLDEKNLFEISREYKKSIFNISFDNLL